MAIKVLPQFEWLEKDRFHMFDMEETGHVGVGVGKDVIFLTLGKTEQELAIDEKVESRATEAIHSYPQQSNVQPQGLIEFRQTLCDMYKTHYNVSISPRNILINFGSSAFFRNVMQLMTGPETEVLLPKPYYPLYRISAKLTGTVIRYYSIIAKGDSYEVDWDSVRAGVTPKTRVVVVCHPGNPYGNLWTEADLVKLNDIIVAQGENILVLNDEIYLGCYFTDPVAPSVLEMVSRLKASGQWSVPVASSCSLSKMYRMYARRVGWAIVPDELVDILVALQHHTILCVDPIFQYAGMKAVSRHEDIIEIREKYRARRDYAVKKFDDIKDIVTLYPCHGGFHSSVNVAAFMKRFGFESPFQLCMCIYLHSLVTVTPGTDFGDPEIIRLSFTHGRYNEAVDRVTGFFKQWATAGPHLTDFQFTLPLTHGNVQLFGSTSHGRIIEQLRWAEGIKEAVRNNPNGHSIVINSSFVCGSAGAILAGIGGTATYYESSLSGQHYLKTVLGYNNIQVDVHLLAELETDVPSTVETLFVCVSEDDTLTIPVQVTPSVVVAIRTGQNPAAFSLIRGYSEPQVILEGVVRYMRL